ncbi:MAG: HAD-IA family hydrolase [Aquificales bacterium]|nr:HAD-IA family hydrolase [Aquificales bacterium]
MSIPLNPQRISTLLFDLDGTLLDSFAAHYKAYEIILPQFGIEVSQERFFQNYSPDWYHTYRMIGLPEDKWDEADRAWLSAVAHIDCEPFPKTMATLTQLAAQYPLGLITSGSKSRVQRELKYTNLGGFFQTVITGDDVDRPKPDPHGIQLALAAMNAAPETAVYIGDTAVDYETAQAAGLPFIGINGRFHSFSPDANYPCIDCISELLLLLKQA